MINAERIAGIASRVRRAVGRETPHEKRARYSKILYELTHPHTTREAPVVERFKDSAEGLGRAIRTKAIRNLPGVTSTNPPEFHVSGEVVRVGRRTPIPGQSV